MSDQGDLFGDPAPELQPHQWAWCQPCAARHAPGEHIVDERGQQAVTSHPADDQPPVRVVDRLEGERPLGALLAPKAGTWAASVLSLFVADFLVPGSQGAEDIAARGHLTRRTGYTDEMLSAALDPEHRVAYATIRARRVDLVAWGWLRDTGYRTHRHKWWELSPEGRRLVIAGYRPPEGARPPVLTVDPRVGPDD